MGVVELTLHKPKAVHRKGSRLKKKRKRRDGKTEEAEVNSRVGTRSYKCTFFRIKCRDSKSNPNLYYKATYLYNQIIHHLLSPQI
ncbi:hypothetical protein RO3G_09117 [Rhizopus delemar RA 99-880]|uniref:Uncharacterized protein n=1 Tax=Rhizopus delemar (strain RA 99-880 / ATCC MYA-4621 / FGSC 9543 / NRRL 43880) TaxID=246409 RepID=I1C7H7_RHIO9|nr:hypothetical protein RO3G_09117 [Rhizopus delemar RA 99-880]|eukprot:EIE84407.1 hypothetical protein RO3G_09117 [Rhizopus delemar RA 99-880]